MSAFGLYIWEDGAPRLVEDVHEWAVWFEHSERRVVVTDIGALSVSTIFLGLDHNWQEGRRPLLFETMIFGDVPELSDAQWRYCTLDEARRGHCIICDKAAEFFPDVRHHTIFYKVGHPWE